MVDIIIPAYNAHATIEKTIHSICSQVFDKKINIYICNDKSDKDYSDIVKKFKDDINIKEIVLDTNSGPGVARQRGLEASNSKYVLFIDSDDLLYTPYSLKKLYNKIENDNLDVVVGSFIEESENEEFIHNEDFTWLHGKMYRRKFIEKNNIKFNKSRENEDFYFNKLIFMRLPKFDVLDECVYLWSNTKGSITTSNNYAFEGLKSFSSNSVEIIKNAIKDDLDRDIIAEFATSFILAIYFNYINYQDTEDCSKLIEDSKELKSLFDKYRANGEDFDIVYSNQFNYYCNSLDYNKTIKPSITFDSFLELYK